MKKKKEKSLNSVFLIDKKTNQDNNRNSRKDNTRVLVIHRLSAPPSRSTLCPSPACSASPQC